MHSARVVKGAAPRLRKIFGILYAMSPNAQRPRRVTGALGFDTVSKLGATHGAAQAEPKLSAARPAHPDERIARNMAWA